MRAGPLSRPTTERGQQVGADPLNHGERLRALETLVIGLQADMRDLTVLIEGPPREDSLRGRLHRLESNEAAAHAAAAALEAARAMREHAFSRGQKLIALVFAVVTTGCTVLTTIAVLSNHVP